MRGLGPDFPCPLLGHHGPCWSSGDPAQEQKEGGEGGEGCPCSVESPCPQGHSMRGTNPRAGPGRACLLGVSAPRGRRLCQGPGLSTRTDAPKGSLPTPVGTPGPVDSPPPPRRCQPGRQCKRLPRTHTPAWQDTDTPHPLDVSSRCTRAFRSPRRRASRRSVCRIRYHVYFSVDGRVRFPLNPPHGARCDVGGHTACPNPSGVKLVSVFRFCPSETESGQGCGSEPMPAAASHPKPGPAPRRAPNSGSPAAFIYLCSF